MTIPPNIIHFIFHHAEHHPYAVRHIGSFWLIRIRRPGQEYAKANDNRPLSLVMFAQDANFVNETTAAKRECFLPHQGGVEEASPCKSLSFLHGPSWPPWVNFFLSDFLPWRA
jgi:hypothetical protein